MMWRGKLNKIRTVGMGLIFFGFIIMYAALLFRSIPWLMYIVMFLGFLSIIASVFVYFWVGLLSTKSTVVACPECGKHTKIFGKTDQCSHCGQMLSFDPKYADPSEGTQQ